MAFALVVAAVGVIGAVMAALTGAGIGSTLVPLFSLRLDFKLAVAAAALPHLVGSVMRVVELRAHVDRRLLLRFGLLCAVASLLGALAQRVVTSPAIRLRLRRAAGAGRRPRRVVSAIVVVIGVLLLLRGK